MFVLLKKGSSILNSDSQHLPVISTVNVPFLHVFSHLPL